MRVLAVDWSGDRKHAAKKIWLCEAADGQVVRLECGRTRKEIRDHLADEGRPDTQLVVGLDFAFSFPAGFLRKRGHRRVETVWEEAEALGEEWLRHCPSPPFWGKPGKKKPALGDALFRKTELTVQRETGARPKSVFQIGGAGAVGVGSIRGMPVLRHLREAGFAIWPFHEPRLPLVVEIWPRLLTGAVIKKRREERQRFLAERYPEIGGSIREAAVRSDDAFDALVSALEMDRNREEFDRLRRAEGRSARLEGTIFRPGVGGARVGVKPAG